MGKGSAPSSQNISQTNLPEYVRPQFEALIKRAEGVSQAEYQPFTGQRVATEGMGDIQGAYDITRNVAGAGVAGLPQAMGVTGRNMILGQQLAQQAGQPFQFGQAGFSQFAPETFGGFQAGEVAPFGGFQQQQFDATQVSPFAGFQESTVDPFAGFQESGAEAFQFAPTERFSGAAVQNYMSPYMQAVVERQQQDALQQFGEQRAGRATQAVRAGAFGGSRQAVQEGIAERGLLDRLAGIQATGSQQAFEQAAQQFGADRAAEFARQQAQAGEFGRTQGIGVSEAARVQAARAAELARTQGIGVEEARRIQEARAQEQARVQGIDVQEQARIQQAQAAEAARVQEAQAQELARVQGVDIEEARRIQEARAAEAARVQGIQAGELGRVQAADAAEMARVQAAQAAENRAAQQQQLQALGFSSDQAQRLVDLSGVGRAADIQGAQLLEAIGRSQRALEQEQLDVGYQDFLRQQAFPEQQLQFLSSILRGVPVQPSVTQTAYAPFNPLQQLAGAGLAGLGLYRGLQ